MTLAGGAQTCPATAQGTSPTGLSIIAPKHLEIGIWHDGPESALEPARELIRLFQRENSGVFVHLVPRSPRDAYATILGWLGPEAAYAPDLVVMPDTWLPDFARYVQALDRVIPASDLAQLAPAVRTQLQVRQRVRAVPWRVDSRVVFVRKDLREAQQLPPAVDWREAIGVAAILHDPPTIYGIGLPGSTEGDGASLVLDLLWAMGGALFDASGRISIDVAKLTDALGSYENAAPSAQPERLTWSQAELETMFAKGRLAAVVADSGFAGRLAATPGSPAWEVCPFAVDGSGCGDILVQGLALLRSSDRIPEAEAFLRLAASARGQELLTQMGGVPATLAGIGRWRADPARAVFVANLDRGSGVPPEHWARLRQVLGRALFAVASGRQLPADAAAIAVADLRLTGPAASPEDDLS